MVTIVTCVLCVQTKGQEEVVLTATVSTEVKRRVFVNLLTLTLVLPAAAFSSAKLQQKPVDSNSAVFFLLLLVKSLSQQQQLSWVVDLLRGGGSTD